MLRIAVSMAVIGMLASGCAGKPSPSRVGTGLDGEPVSCEFGDDRTQLRDGVAFIQPGVTGCLELRVEGEALVPVAFVGAATEQTLVLKVWADGSNVYLSVQNPFPRHVRYRAGMLLPGEERFRSTSSCPVVANRGALEHWPHAIEALAMTDFVQVPDDGEMVCN